MWKVKLTSYFANILLVNFILIIFELCKHFVLTGSSTMSPVVSSGYLVFLILALIVGYYKISNYNIGRQHANNKFLYEIVFGIKLELIASFIIWLVVSCIAYFKYYTSFRDQKIAIGIILVTFFFIFKQLIELIGAGILIGMLNWKYNKN